MEQNLQKLNIVNSKINDKIEDFDPEKIVFGEIKINQKYDFNYKFNKLKYFNKSFDNYHPKLDKIKTEFPPSFAFVDRIQKYEENKNIKYMNNILHIQLDPDPRRNPEGWKKDKQIIDYINSIYIKSTKHIIKLGLEKKLDKRTNKYIQMEFRNFLKNPEEYDEEFEDVINLQEKYNVLRNPLCYNDKYKDENFMISDPNIKCFLRIKIRDKSEFYYIDPDSPNTYLVDFENLVKLDIVGITGKFRIILSTIKYDGIIPYIEFNLESCSIIKIELKNTRYIKESITDIRENYYEDLRETKLILLELFDEEKDNLILLDDESSGEIDEKIKISNYLNFDEESENKKIIF